MSVQPKDTSKGHFYVSLVKSGVRIAAGAALMAAGSSLIHFDLFVAVAGALLIGAEILGIVEELV